MPPDASSSLTRYRSATRSPRGGGSDAIVTDGVGRTDATGGTGGKALTA